MSRTRIALVLVAVFAVPGNANAVGTDLPIDPPVHLPGVTDAAAPEALVAGADPMVGKINRARRRHGRRPLRTSGSLCRSSRRFGRHLMRINRFAHDSHIWASRRFRRKGEVLAMHTGWRSRRSGTIRSWMNSPTHRNVLLGRYRYVGVAGVRGRFGRRRATIWVAQVAR